MNFVEEFKNKRLPLNIQYFADEGSDNEDDDSDDVEDNNNGNKESDNKGNNSKESEKKYTDKEVNDISKKNVDKATKKLMKDLGIDDVEEAKTILANARAEKEKNKSAEDKANDYTKALSDKDNLISETKTKLVDALLENRLMKQGVDSGKIARAIKMIDAASVLNEDGEVDNDLMTTEIEKLLKEFPEFKNKSEDENKSKGFKFGSDGKDDKGKEKKQDPTQMKRWNRFR